MPVTLLGPDDYTTMPWANGKGSTVEYACERRSGGQVLWRFSQASVVEDGAFSLFPGIDRTIMLVSGPGFHLDFGGAGSADVIEPFQPVRFSGDWVTRASGVSAACEDMNVMTARGFAHSAVRIHRSDAELVLSDRTLLFVHEGKWQFEAGGAEHALAVSQSALICGETGTVSIRGSGLLVEIAIDLI
ncbi:HutD/Ves family protein [Pararhizobium sp.]|uniref:HutD/Ves family protein n=1 Tax=Pararhizobium sp. TaxID=1977563 RepID=UPI0027230E05|nr:HutD family protein [Pararhizobium sp.]MDO9416671.1 HutD family protein [Pararhizobium sp.]